MAAKPVKVAFLADTADLRSSLAKAEASMDGAAATAKTAAVLTAATGGVPANKTEGTSAATLQARFTTQGSTGAPSDITAGIVDIFLRIIDVAALE